MDVLFCSSLFCSSHETGLRCLPDACRVSKEAQKQYCIQNSHTKVVYYSTMASLILKDYDKTRVEGLGREEKGKYTVPVNRGGRDENGL